MKRLLTVTAVIEAGAGLAFLVVPAVVVQLLLGADISGAGIPLGRVAGAALLVLGVACWVARGDAQSRAAKGLVTAMLFHCGPRRCRHRVTGGWHRVVAGGHYSCGNGGLVRKADLTDFFTSGIEITASG